MKCFANTVALAVLAVSLSASAFAGGHREGNGGGVWTCREKSGDHDLRSITLVDLFEGRKEFNLDIPKDSDLSLEAILDSVERKIFSINKDYYTEYTKQLQIVRNTARFVKDTKLEVIDDALYRSRPAPETCKNGKIEYEQLANYTKDDFILVDDRLWNNKLFSVVDQAALYVHEAIYALLREKEEAKDSVKARKIVGHLLSTKPTSDYAHLLTLPTPPPPPVEDSGSLDWQMEKILGDWDDGESVFRFRQESDHTILRYLCNRTYYYDNHGFCRYSGILRFSYLRDYGFVSLNFGRGFGALGVRVQSPDWTTAVETVDPMGRYGGSGQITVFKKTSPGYHAK